MFGQTDRLMRLTDVNYVRSHSDPCLHGFSALAKSSNTSISLDIDCVKPVKLCIIIIESGGGELKIGC